jgi:hypothetical protein
MICSIGFYIVASAMPLEALALAPAGRCAR